MILGQIADQAECRNAVIDAESRVRDYARVLGGTLRRTTVQDRARVYGGELHESTVGVEAKVSGGFIIGSIVAGDEVAGNPVLNNAGLFDQSCVWDSPRLNFTKLTGGARVYGNAQILGKPGLIIELHGDMRICTGTWQRAPRYIHLGFCFLTEAAEGRVMVDCKLASYDYWFRAGERYARRWYGWTGEQSRQVIEVLQEWQSKPMEV